MPEITLPPVPESEITVVDVLCEINDAVSTIASNLDLQFVHGISDINETLKDINETLKALLQQREK